MFSSIDRGGRYAYRNQPGIAQWNLARLTEALLPLLGGTEDAALERGREILARFSPLFHAAHLDGFRRKLGLAQACEGDAALLEDLLDRMAGGRADFTLTFRRLCDAAVDPARDREVRDLFVDPTAYDGWAVRWRARLADAPEPGADRRAAMRAVNPALVPRNHRVEEAIAAAVGHGDLGPFERLGAALARPYDEPADAGLAEPPSFDTSGYRTFCGT